MIHPKDRFERRILSEKKAARESEHKRRGRKAPVQIAETEDALNRSDLVEGQYQERDFRIHPTLPDASGNN